MQQLVLVYENKEWDISGRKKLLIGRKRTNDIVIKDHLISGHHAEISNGILRDLSTNGTRVNGMRITEHRIMAGDQISIGADRVLCIEAKFFKNPATIHENSVHPFGGEIGEAEEAKIFILADGLEWPAFGGTGLVVGRTKHCDIVIKLPGVSRKHCQILDGVVRDLGSANGTTVNGEELKSNMRQKLKVGDCIEIGSVENRAKLVVVRRPNGPTNPGFASGDSKVTASTARPYEKPKTGPRRRRVVDFGDNVASNASLASMASIATDRTEIGNMGASQTSFGERAGSQCSAETSVESKASAANNSDFLDDISDGEDDDERGDLMESGAYPANEGESQQARPHISSIYSPDDNGSIASSDASLSERNNASANSGSGRQRGGAESQGKRERRHQKSSHVGKRSGRGSLEKKVGSSPFMSIGERVAAAKTRDDFISVMRILASQGEGEKARSVLRKLPGRGIQANAMCYFPVIGAFKNIGNAKECMALIEELEALRLHSDPKELRGLSFCFNAAIGACKPSGNIALVNVLMDKMDRLRVPKDVYTYTSAIGVCERGGYWKKVLKYLETMEEDSALNPQAVTYNTAIAACGKECTVALELLERMVKRGVRPNQRTFGAAIRVCSKAAQWRQAIALFNQVEKNGVRLNDHIYMATISACKEAAQWEWAVKLTHLYFENIPPGQGSIMIANCAMAACANAGRAEEALKLLIGLKRWKLKPNQLTWSSLLMASSQSYRPLLAIDVLELLRVHYHHPPDIALYHCAMLACEKSEMWTEADRIWRYICPPNKQQKASTPLPPVSPTPSPFRRVAVTPPRIPSLGHNSPNIQGKIRALPPLKPRASDYALKMRIELARRPPRPARVLAIYRELQQGSQPTSEANDKKGEADDRAEGDGMSFDESSNGMSSTNGKNAQKVTLQAIHYYHAVRAHVIVVHRKNRGRRGSVAMRGPNDPGGIFHAISVCKAAYMLGHWDHGIFSTLLYAAEMDKSAPVWRELLMQIAGTVKGGPAKCLLQACAILSCSAEARSCPKGEDSKVSKEIELIWTCMEGEGTGKGKVSEDGDSNSDGYRLISRINAVVRDHVLAKFGLACEDEGKRSGPATARRIGGGGSQRKYLHKFVHFPPPSEAVRKACGEFLEHRHYKELEALAYVMERAEFGETNEVLLALEECSHNFMEGGKRLKIAGAARGRVLSGIASQLEPGDQVLDVGGYIGYSAIVMANVLKSRGGAGKKNSSSSSCDNSCDIDGSDGGRRPGSDDDNENHSAHIEDGRKGNARVGGSETNGAGDERTSTTSASGEKKAGNHNSNNSEKTHRQGNSRVVSIEMDFMSACIARWLVFYAGVSDYVEVRIGKAEDAIRGIALQNERERLSEVRKGKSASTALKFAMVFMDHNCSQYHKTLLRLEELRLMKKNTYLVADNVLFPGAPLFLWYILQTGRFTGIQVCQMREKVHGAMINDWMSVCKYTGYGESEKGRTDSEEESPAATFAPRSLIVPNEFIDLAAEIESLSYRAQRSKVNVMDWKEHAEKVKKVYTKMRLLAKYRA